MAGAMIEVDELGKRYRLRGRAPYGRQSYARLSDDLAHLFRRPFRRTSSEDWFWALRDVSFAVSDGEVVGVVGGNGAGKSTLLKLLGRVTDPSSGEARLHGRVGSLLEVGTGFHPELTGRENIFMSGAILGMRTAEIRSRFDEIVEFAEMQRFLETPVKHYSSGMQVRLAFAVAAHLEPEILLVDEVLAVGDLAFQQRCLGKLGQVSRGGRTVLFVSHNMSAVEQLCERVIVLERGRVVFDGETQAGVECYVRSHARLEGAAEARREFTAGDADGGRGLRLRAVGLAAADGERRRSFAADEPVVVEVEYDLDRPVRGMRLRIWICTPEEVPVLVVTDQACRGPVQAAGRHLSRCTLPGGLFNTRAYRVEVEADVPGVEALLERVPCVGFVVSGAGNHDSISPEPWPGVVSPVVSWDLDAEPSGPAPFGDSVAAPPDLAIGDAADGSACPAGDAISDRAARPRYGASAR
jgi:lipopolysaccharide transport system ATP-binding protein